MSYKIIPRPDTMRSEEVKHEKLRSPFNKFKTSQNCGHLLLSNRGKSKWKCNFYLGEVFLLHPDLPVVTVSAHFCHRLLQNLEHFICKFKVPRFTISITFVTTARIYHYCSTPSPPKMLLQTTSSNFLSYREGEVGQYSPFPTEFPTNFYWTKSTVKFQLFWVLQALALECKCLKKHVHWCIR